MASPKRARRDSNLRLSDRDGRVGAGPHQIDAALGLLALPNAPPSNLVQMGIGGWYGSRPGMKVARERNTTVPLLDLHGVGGG